MEPVPKLGALANHSFHSSLYVAMDDSDLGVLPRSLQGLSTFPRNKGGRGFDAYDVGRSLAVFVADPVEYIEEKYIAPVEEFISRKRKALEFIAGDADPSDAMPPKRIAKRGALSRKRPYNAGQYRRSSYRKSKTPMRYRKKIGGLKLKTSKYKSYRGLSAPKCLDMNNKPTPIPDIRNAEVNEWKGANQTITVGVSNALIGGPSPPTYSTTTSNLCRPVAGACSAYFSANTLWAGNVLQNVAKAESKEARDIYVSKYETSIYLTNSSTSKGVLTEWVLTPLQNMNVDDATASSLVTFMGANTLDQNAGDMTGLANQDLYSPENFPDYDPTSSEFFTLKYKLLKKKTYALEPGAHLVLNYKSSVNRKYEERRFALDWTSNYPGVQPVPKTVQQFKGVTRTSIFCWRGVPAHQEDDATKFGWTRPQLDIIRNVTVQYRVIPGNALQSGVIGFVPPTAGANVVAGAEPMQIGAVDEMPPVDDV